MNAAGGADEAPGSGGPPESAADLEEVIAGFSASRNLFGALVEDLRDESADQLTHAQLEDLIATRGREVMRRLLQDHLDLRSIREPRLTQVTGADQITRRRIEPGHERLLTTVFGPVTVTRTAYRALRASNLHPMDAALNLPAERSSHGLRRLAALEAVRGSFDDAQAAIERGCGTRISKRQVEQLTVRAGADIEAFYRARVPLPCTADTLLVLSVDGKGIVMRPEALTDATRKAAEVKGGNKMRTRLVGGEKNGRKRMAMLGAVYDAEPKRRAIDDIITPDHGPSSRRADRNRGPVAFNKWLTGSVTDNTQTVILAVFDQAEQRDPLHAGTWIILVDGAKAQIEQLQTEAALRAVDVHIVVDFVHVFGLSPVLGHLLAFAAGESGDAIDGTMTGRAAHGGRIDCPDD